MNEANNANVAEQSGSPKNIHLLSIGSEVLEPLTSALENTQKAVEMLETVSDPYLVKRAQSLGRKLQEFEPSVTLVGQVKAGKTALTNVLAGVIDLLPSDVNPWTSVVTTLHLNSKTADKKTKARFTFFDREEWDSLMVKGGRMGELAERAGASEEMEKIQIQIAKMYQQTKVRLGDSFAHLLGQTQKYGYYDKELITRYVCMGEPEEYENDIGNKQGRFADITRTAELFIDQPERPGSLALRDTPGVNDTFMVREQITLKSLRGSEICLVVLSAHQALNTTDMALVRMISNFEKRQVILFVNRIDELAQPSVQIPEIRDSIRATLKELKSQKDCEIIFGSAKWAEAALTGELDTLNDDSQAALLDWATQPTGLPVHDAISQTWALSGVPHLLIAINERIMEGSGKRLLDSISVQLNNLTSELKAEAVISQVTDFGENTSRLQGAEVRNALEHVIAENERKLKEATDKILSDLKPRLIKAQDSFVRRATDALITHLERYGEQEAWQYDSTGLRLLLRSAYAQFGTATKRQITAVFSDAASDIEDVYTKALGAQIGEFKIEPPVTPVVPAPVVLGKTIALDLNGSWWRRWRQKRKGFGAFANDYAELILAEVGSIIEELEQTQVAGVFDEIERSLAVFLQEQRDALMRLSNGIENGQANEAGGATRDQAEHALDDALVALSQAAA